MTQNETTQSFSSEDAIEGFVGLFEYHQLPVFDYQTLDYNLQGLFRSPQRSAYLMLQEFARKTIGEEAIKRCVIDYIYSNHVQAYATTHKDHHYIAVGHALPVLLQVLFQQLVRDTNPFSDEPDTTPTDFLFPTTLDEPSIGDETIESLLLGTMPEERWQRLMSVRLAELAIMFCFCHELSHIVWGHGSLSVKRGLWSVAEVNDEFEVEARKISPRLAQAWELQADRSAMAFLFSYVSNNLRHGTAMANALMCNPREPFEEQLLARLVYAVSFVFFLFGQTQESVDSVVDHPSALARQTFAIASIASQYANKYPDRDEDHFVTLVQEAANRAEHAWNRLGFTFGNYGHHIDELVPVVQRLSRYDALSARFLRRHQWVDDVRDDFDLR